ncbi:MAG: hypothetical protein HS108_02920 [Planctomycetes bacterium]|jgi:hypothetical protein|nr:hypothetical protein [Planctomycetota bacterium]MCL4730113.1 hypothetical protein [Planctomycetota bacterium]
MANRLVKRAPKAPLVAPKDPLQRARDNYPRRVAMPVSMAQAMSVFLDEARKLNKSRRARIQGALEIALAEIPGLAGVRDRIKVGGVDKGGTVQLVVDGPTLAHELGVVYKAALLDKLRRLLQGKDSLAGITVKAGRTAQRIKQRDV